LLSENKTDLGPTVVEADEYDRSFLTLHPNISIITSVDADHLDIYAEHKYLKESFELFAAQTKLGGCIISKKGLDFQVPDSSKHTNYSYSLHEKADFYAENIRILDGNYVFDLRSTLEDISDIHFSFPGLHNVENAIAASAAAQIYGITASQLKNALSTFLGVKRRFDYRIKNKNLVFIDDYAHHPEELKACISSVKELYPSKKITGIFQPHLYSRTRDFADEFAKSLDLLDETVLLEIYPARELPLSGVTSNMLLDKMKSSNKFLSSKEDLIKKIVELSPEVLLTLGAGDIDKLVEPLEIELRNKYHLNV
jgi:UDP-N-acetylmuramate--alanine ligase